MHMGGGFSKLVARSVEPSAAGQGVTPVMSGTVVSGTVVASEVSEAATPSSSCPIKRDSPKAATRASTTMMPMRMTFLRLVLRRWARSISARRA